MGERLSANGCFLKCSRRYLLLRCLLFRWQNVDAIDPCLYGDHAIRGARFRECVINVGAERVERQTALQIPLGACDFISVQPARYADLDAFAAEAQRGIHRLAHGAAEADALFQLQRIRLRDQSPVELRLVYFLNVDEHVARRPLLQVLLELVNFRALAADDDARTRGADNDAQLVAGTLDVDRAHARRLELLPQLFLKLHVFEKQLVVIAFHKPARFPRLGIAEAKSVWMNLLSHNFPSTSSRPLCGSRSSFSLPEQPSSWLPELPTRPRHRRLSPELPCRPRLVAPGRFPDAKSAAGSDTRVPWAPDEYASCVDHRWRQHV